MAARRKISPTVLLTHIITDLTINWSDEEIKQIFGYYKEYGSKWSVIARHFPGKTENNVKNKFYTILKKVATQEQLRNPGKFGGYLVKTKENLIQFVDQAIEYGHLLPSKRGRKTRITPDSHAPKHFPSPPVSVPDPPHFPSFNTWNRVSEKKSEDISSEDFKEGLKRNLVINPSLPGIPIKQDNSLVLTYPMSFALSMPGLCGVYPFVPAVPYSPGALCLSISNQQY